MCAFIRLAFQILIQAHPVSIPQRSHPQIRGRVKYQSSALTDRASTFLRCSVACTIRALGWLYCVYTYVQYAEHHARHWR